MNKLVSLFEVAWSERLGWTILHSLWEIAAVTTVYAGALLWLRRTSAGARYVLGCVALVAMISLPLATFALLDNPRSQAKAIAVSIADHSPAYAESVAEPTESEFSDSTDVAPPVETHLDATHSTVGAPVESALPLWSERVGPFLRWVSVGWVVGVILFSVRPLLGLLTVRRLRSRGLSPPSTKLAQLAGELIVRLRMRQSVQFAQSALVQVPTVLGYLRPIVLLPASALTGLSTQQLELILAHELAHIRRHDYLVNLLQTGIETILFYHPGTWWVSAQVRKEREHCCDDEAVRLCGSRGMYVRALLAMEQQRALTPLVLAASGGSLVERARRLISPTASETGPERATAWLAGLLPLGVIAVLLLLGSSFAVNGSGQDTEIQGKQAATAQQKDEPPSDVPLKTVESPDEKPTVKSAGPKVALSGGGSIELVAVGYCPREGKPWWSPSGAVLPKAEFVTQSSVTNGPDEEGRYFLFQLNSVPGQSGLVYQCDWKTGGMSSFSNQQPAGSTTPSTAGLAATIPSSLKSVTLKVGIAGGEWKTMMQSDGHGRAATGSNPVSVILGEAFETDGTTRISFAHNKADYECRIVAVGAHEKEHTTSRIGNASASDVVMEEATFEGLPLEQIRKFKVQIRPYHWIEFRNVSVLPGNVTKVEAVLESPPGAKGSAPSPGPKRDTDAIQGAWNLVDRVYRGKSDPLKDAALTFTDDRLLLSGFDGPGSKKEFSFKLDPSKKPKTMDLTAIDGPHKGKSAPAIYELNDGDLKLCLSNDETQLDRPTEFKSEEGTQLMVLVLKPMKK